MTLYYYDKYEVDKEYFYRKSTLRLGGDYGFNVETLKSTYSYYPRYSTNEKTRTFTLEGNPIVRRKGDNPVVGYYTQIQYETGEVKRTSVCEVSSNLGIYGGERCHSIDEIRYERLSRDIQGKFIEKITAQDGQYPTNGKMNGYWYVRRGEANTPPTLYDNTQTNKTLYENNVLTLNGTTKDEDIDDVVTVKYQVNSGTTRVISAGVTSTSYNKTLKFREGYMYDGNTKVSSKLADNTKHTIRIWAEDDKDTKSEEKIINFYVVNNRPASIQIDEIVEQTDLVETDYVKITGKVEDPEKDETTLYYKINKKPFVKVDKGSNRSFELRIPVMDLMQGENQLIVRAEDSYGSITERTVILNKQGNSIPLKEGFIEYKLLPPEGETDGLLLWIEREVGDLETEVHVKFGNKEYKKINKKYVGVIEAGVLEEDEYIIENDTKVKDIFLRITMKRNSTNSKRGIRKISGVFN